MGTGDASAPATSHSARCALAMTGELGPERIVRLEDDPPRVVVLDQRRLPGEVVELECRSAADVAAAIETLAVRGAPAIGVAAAYGYALAAALGHDLDEAAAVLASSRPTAINLVWALEQVRAADDPAERARELHREEVDRCRRMAAHAAGLIGRRPLIVEVSDEVWWAWLGAGDRSSDRRLGGLAQRLTRGLLPPTSWQSIQAGAHVACE